MSQSNMIQKFTLIDLADHMLRVMGNNNKLDVAVAISCLPALVLMLDSDDIVTVEKAITTIVYIVTNSGKSVLDIIMDANLPDDLLGDLLDKLTKLLVDESTTVAMESAKALCAFLRTDTEIGELYMSPHRNFSSAVLSLLNKPDSYKLQDATEDILRSMDPIDIPADSELLSGIVELLGHQDELYVDRAINIIYILTDPDDGNDALRDAFVSLPACLPRLIKCSGYEFRALHSLAVRCNDIRFAHFVATPGCLAHLTIGLRFGTDDAFEAFNELVQKRSIEQLQLIASFGCIPQLVFMVKRRGGQEAEAVELLGNLAYGSQILRAQIMAVPDLLTSVVALLRPRPLINVSNFSAAATALSKMVTDDASRLQLLQEPGLLECLAHALEWGKTREEMARSKGVNISRSAQSAASQLLSALGWRALRTVAAALPPAPGVGALFEHLSDTPFAREAVQSPETWHDADWSTIRKTLLTLPEQMRLDAAMVSIAGTDKSVFSIFKSAPWRIMQGIL